ncbi:Protein O-linked-mannose beta-1,2-N-acetylglucosaminyltransferase 1, partial [Geodia barretti]
GEGRERGRGRRRCGEIPNPTTWGNAVNLRVTVPLTDDAVVCDWPDSPENRKRRSFCSRYEGYGSLCHCSNPLPLSIRSPPLPGSRVTSIPVAIIASNRPQYLFRMLRGLLAAKGANASLVTVYIDGFFQEPKEVAELFGIRAIQHEPKSLKNGRYLSTTSPVSLTPLTTIYQTMPLLESDSSVYCISAWNDQGYDHSCQDPSLLYRVETMPGLGWMLKRSLYKNELEPNWPSPDKLWDWDMWMRLDVIRKGRECIVPDVSRTYHFGASGLNMNPYFQEHYFKKHTLNTIPDVILRDVDSLTRDNYELVIHNLLRKANVLDHSKNPCGDKFIPKKKGNTYVMYISMDNEKDFDHWMKLATCFHLWDLDARGFHNGLWRFWMKGNHILVVGAPYSPYASKYMPSGIRPLKLVTPSQR